MPLYFGGIFGIDPGMGEGVPSKTNTALEYRDAAGGDPKKRPPMRPDTWSVALCTEA